MSIVLSCSKLRLAAFHLGHPPPSYGGSKVTYRFLSLDTLWRSHFRPYRGTSWPGWLGHFIFRRLGVRGQEPRHRVMVWHLTVKIYNFVRIYKEPKRSEKCVKWRLVIGWSLHIFKMTLAYSMSKYPCVYLTPSNQGTVFVHFTLWWAFFELRPKCVKSAPNDPKMALKYLISKVPICMVHALRFVARWALFRELSLSTMQINK